MNNKPTILEQAWDNTHACLLSDGLYYELSILLSYDGLILFLKYQKIDNIESIK